jgi:hypothetical protein
MAYFARCVARQGVALTDLQSLVECQLIIMIINQVLSLDSHFLIVNKTSFSLSLSLSRALSPPPQYLLHLFTDIQSCRV